MYDTLQKAGFAWLDLYLLFYLHHHDASIAMEKMEWDIDI